jgi:hypothetical protein
MERGVKTRMDLWARPMFGDKKEYQLSNSPFDEQTPQLSPDGRWLAYSSDETGNYEIYVQSFSTDGKLGSDNDVSPDGQRFLIGTLIGESKAAPPTVILNWTAAWKK